MKLSKRTKVCCSIAMSVWLTNLPAHAVAEMSMIPTSVVATQMSRAEASDRVLSLLEQQNVREQLTKNGVSPEEAEARIANLSDQELRQLAGQIEQARAGGDILVTILLIVLIIFLVKRI